MSAALIEYFDDNDNDGYPLDIEEFDEIAKTCVKQIVHNRKDEK